jgi:hypothetical protein
VSIEAKPVGEPVAALEKDKEMCMQDRHDLWDTVNDRRPLPVLLAEIGKTMADVKALCETKDARIKRSKQSTMRA